MLKRNTNTIKVEGKQINNPTRILVLCVLCFECALREDHYGDDGDASKLTAISNELFPIIRGYRGDIAVMLFNRQLADVTTTSQPKQDG